MTEETSDAIERLRQKVMPKEPVPPDTAPVSPTEVVLSSPAALDVPLCGKCRKPKGTRQEGECRCGRPWKFQSAEDMQQAIDDYFAECRTPKPVTHEIEVYNKELDDMEIQTIITTPAARPLTISGLALALNTNRQTLNEYSFDDEFADTIKKARAIVEAYAQEQLYRGTGQVTGIIFDMKNNHGYRDQTEHLNTNIDGNAVLAEIQNRKKQLIQANKPKIIDVTPK